MRSLAHTHTFSLIFFFTFRFGSSLLLSLLMLMLLMLVACYFLPHDSICVCFYLPQYSFDMRTLEIVSWSSHCLQQLPLSSRIEQIARLILPVLKEIEWVFYSHHLSLFYFHYYFSVFIQIEKCIRENFHTHTHTPTHPHTSNKK